MDRPPGHIAFVRIVTDSDDVDDIAQKIEMLLETEPTFKLVKVEGFLD